MTDIITINTAEEILRRFGPDPNEPDPDDFSPTFWESTCEEMLKEEADWQQRGLIFSWIDEKPECVSAIWWDIMGVLPDPDKPCVRRFRLSLPGGGQIRVTENFVPMSSGGNDVICYEPKLGVQAETNTGLHTTDGIVTRPYYEMSAYAAVFPPRTPQAIADRTAATLRLSGTNHETFAALLAGGGRCGICGRQLKDEISKLLGIGPECAKAMNLSHDVATANRVLARRRELLGDKS